MLLLVLQETAAATRTIRAAKSRERALREEGMAGSKAGRIAAALVSGTKHKRQKKPTKNAGGSKVCGRVHRLCWKGLWHGLGAGQCKHQQGTPPGPEASLGSHAASLPAGCCVSPLQDEGGEGGGGLFSGDGIGKPGSSGASKSTVYGGGARSGKLDKPKTSALLGAHPLSLLLLPRLPESGHRSSSQE